MAARRDDVHVEEREQTRVGPDDGAGPRVLRREPRDTGTWDVELPEALNLARDRVRWGPIVAGFFTALTMIVMLGLLGMAIGLTTVGPGGAQGAEPTPGTMALVWGAATFLIAFFLGGFVAGRTAAVFDRGWGAWNGALVFVVTVPFMLWFAGQTVGMVVSVLGNFASALNVNVAGAVAITGQPAADAAATARNAAWGAFIALVVGLVASAAGGALGTRRELGADRATGRVVRS